MNVARIRASRDTWKTLAVQRRKAIESKQRQMDKKIQAISDLQERLAQAEARGRELERSILTAIEPQQPVLRAEVRIICVMVFLLGIVPCNAVARVIEYLSRSRRLACSWVPHPSSVVNWVGRAGLGLLASVEPIKEPWVAIIDTSIAFGKAKLLIALRLPMSHFLKGSGSVTLADVQCIGLSVGQTWNGESVFAALQGFFDKSGLPAAILKDGGQDLSKGVRLLRQLHPGIVVLRDIGHVVANELKAMYSRNSVLSRYLELVDTARSRMCQSTIAALRPPKIRAKGRVQSISRVVNWSTEVLGLMGVAGRANDGDTLAKIRTALPGFPRLRFFIERFARDCSVLDLFMQLLKCKGLNQENFHQAISILNGLPARSRIRKNLLTWLRKQMRLQCRLSIGQTPLVVSSDVIETLMGSLKNIIERKPIPEFSSMTLATPLLCGLQTEEDIQMALGRCSHEQLSRWRSENCRETHRKIKQRLLANRGAKAVQETPIAQTS